MTPILGIMASQISGHLTPLSSFESIATITGTGSSASVNFTSIPATYKHLQVRWIAKDTYTAVAAVNYLEMRISSITSSTYASHFVLGTNSTASAGASSSLTYSDSQGGIISSGTGMTNMFGVGIMDILDYASTTKAKTIRTFGGGDINNSAGGKIYMSSALSTPTTAIDKITLMSPYSAFTTTSTFALYGIKG